MTKKLKQVKKFYGLNGAVIHCWSRENGDAVLLSSSNYGGDKSFDLRQWYKAGNKFRPTKRGVRIHPNELKQLFVAIRKLKKLDDPYR